MAAKRRRPIDRDEASRLLQREHASS
ncbi:hypothetical protein ACFT8Q_13425 [Streptomyces griseoincarnatus]